MKFTAVCLSMLLFFSSSAFAEVCGLASASVVERKLILNIADLQSYAGKQVNYNVLNPLDFDWNSGSCLCVDGVTSHDPEYGNDYLYQQIAVDKKVSEDFSGESCAVIVPE